MSPLEPVPQPARNYPPDKSPGVSFVVGILRRQTKVRLNLRHFIPPRWKRTKRRTITSCMDQSKKPGYQECVENAKNARARAVSASSPDAKREFAEIAKLWEELAAQIKGNWRSPNI
jgi:hypothetical protein